LKLGCDGNKIFVLNSSLCCLKLNEGKAKARNGRIEKRMIKWRSKGK
jgi:hypothetical protein